MDYQTLHLLFRCNKEFSHNKIRLQELSDTECMICSYIYSNEGCSQDNVSTATKTDKTTIGKALAVLENKGCVRRERDSADRRVKRLYLTDVGRERVAELLDLHNNWLNEIMTCLNKKEQRQFEDYCKRLLAAAELLSQTAEGDRP